MQSHRILFGKIWDRIIILYFKEVWDEYLEKRKERREEGMILPRLIRKSIWQVASEMSPEAI